jgi:hypothetical protein
LLSIGELNAGKEIKVSYLLASERGKGNRTVIAKRFEVHFGVMNLWTCP